MADIKTIQTKKVDYRLETIDVVPATFANVFNVSANASFVRLTFAETVLGMEPKTRTAVVMPFQDAKHFAETILEIIKQISEDIDTKKISEE